MMADTGDELMRAVLLAPGEDAPRLRLAEWLMARGDPRGEFIQVQVELAWLGLDAEGADRLDRHARELLAQHEEEWVGPFADCLLGSMVSTVASEITQNC